MRRKQWKKISVIISFLAMIALALSGCSGSDGSAGPAGPTGPTGPTGPIGPAGQNVTNFTAQNVDFLSTTTYTGTITSVSIASPLVVEFRIVDGNGDGVEGLEKPVGTSTSLNNLRFTVAKLVPGTNGSLDKWVSYEIGATFAANNHEKVAANLTPLGNGNYRYTFSRDIKAVSDVTYEPTLTHRVGIRFSGAIPGTSIQMKNSIAFTKDFVPAGGTVRLHEVTTKAACLECHGTFEGRSGGHLAYADPKMCVLCHTDQWRKGATESTIIGTVITPPAGTKNTDIVRGEALLNFIEMIHKAHMGTNLTLTGYAHNNGNWLPNEMAYPQEVTNCRKCHKESAAAPQGDNWKNNPSRLACGSCHDGINWTTGSGHVGGPATSDALCYVCHDPVSIDTLYHVTINATPNNPSVPAGATNFTYEISSLTVNASNQPVVKFRIMAVTPPATTATAVKFNVVSGTNPLSGFTGAPSFLVAYAMPQDSITAPADFNNLGNGVLGAQPVSVSIAKLCDTSITASGTTGSQGSMTGPDADGYYTATLNGPATTIRESVYGATTATAVTATQTVQGIVKGTALTSVGMLASPAMPANPARFPAGAKLRTVALQGYFTQVSPALARHAVMVTKSVSGEARRSVVDSAKCAQCHEYFEGHGGNRNYNMDGCTLCHNPNLSSSGTIVNDPTTPEATQNLKDMIHSIHAAEMRTTAYRHTRSKSGANTVYDWSDVVYPNLLYRCEACHKPGTYVAVPAGALPTTDVTPATALLGSTVFYSRISLPNPTDIVISPYSAACVSCHDSSLAKGHMATNGGVINEVRTAFTAGTEQCAICHGAGRSEDAAAVHANYVAGH